MVPLYRSLVLDMNLMNLRGRVILKLLFYGNPFRIGHPFKDNLLGISAEFVFSTEKQILIDYRLRAGRATNQDDDKFGSHRPSAHTAAQSSKYHAAPLPIGPAFVV